MKEGKKGSSGRKKMVKGRTRIMENYCDEDGGEEDEERREREKRREQMNTDHKRDNVLKKERKYNERGTKKLAKEKY